MYDLWRHRPWYSTNFFNMFGQINPSRTCFLSSTLFTNMRLNFHRSVCSVGCWSHLIWLFELAPGCTGCLRRLEQDFFFYYYYFLGGGGGGGGGGWGDGGGGGGGGGGVGCQLLVLSYDPITHICQRYFTGTRVILWLRMCQWSYRGDMDKIYRLLIGTKHHKWNNEQCV